MGVVVLDCAFENFSVGALESVKEIVSRLPGLSLRMPDNFTRLVADVILAAVSLMATGAVNVLNAFVPVS